MKKAVLQVALDLLELKRALQIAQESLDGGADWIEVGTPLIKSEGMSGNPIDAGSFSRFDNCC